MEAIFAAVVRIEEMLMRVEENQKKIMAAMGWAASDADDRGSFLPFDLRGRNVRYDILVRAVEGGMLVFMNGSLQWRGGSKTLLAYLCGRVWSGDYTHVNTRLGTHSWVHGPWPLPGDALADYFGVPNLKQKRYRQQGLEPPKGYERVDKLFLDRDDE